MVMSVRILQIATFFFSPVVYFLNNQLPFDSTFFLKIEFNAFLVLQNILTCFTYKIQSFLPECWCWTPLMFKVAGLKASETGEKVIYVPVL